MPIDDILLLGLFFMLAAALGWGLARFSGGEHRPGLQKRFSTDYFRGLNFLLNEQPDKAIEIFIRMVEIDSDTIETHFALGSLFRRRGEVDRAIRIHQNLIARPNLGRVHRSHALYELGEDYMKAGLFDRAENLFQDLVNDRLHSEQALRHLITIYEQQKDWDKAINASRQLETVTGISRHEEIAQYYCELAEEGLANGDLRQPGKLLKRALGYDRRCLRAFLLQARLAEEQDDTRLAVRQYRKAVLLAPDFAIEVLPELARLGRQTGGDFAAFAEQFRQQSPLAATHLALTTILDPGIQSPASEQAVEDFIRNSEHLKGLYELIELVSGERTGQHAARDRVREVLRRLLSSGPRYQCRECGFAARSLYWQCPSCRNWNSVRPHFDFSFREITPETRLTDTGTFRALETGGG